MTRSMDTAKLFMRKIEEQDVSGWGQLLSQYAVMETPFSPAGLPTRSEGRAECEATLERVFAMIDRFSWKDLTFYGGQDPDIVFGTARSECMLTTGVSYQNRYCFLFRFRNDLVWEYYEYCDPQPVVAAFGPMLS